MHASPQSIEVFPDSTALIEHAAQWILRKAQAKPSAFTIALSGGSTPKGLYQRLAQEPYGSEMPWTRVHLFWGDERFVAPDDPESNYRMTRLAMLEKIPIPAANIHAVPTDGTPDDAARRYEQVLQAHYGADTLAAGRPLFDLVLLGIGEDGHTASLFPGTKALTEKAAWVTAVIGAKPEPRITLTYPAIASSLAVAFLVSGEGKRAILKRLHDGDESLP